MRERESERERERETERERERASVRACAHASAWMRVCEEISVGGREEGCFFMCASFE